MKRIIVVFGLLIISFCLLAQTPVLPIGAGTEANPYQIATWQNLYWITAPDIVDGLTQTQRWTKYYKQTADIDFADASPAITTWNGGGGWLPIGIIYEIESSANIPFIGKYDGGNHTIAGLYINRPSLDNQGLFGYTDLGAEILNLGMIYVSVTGNYFTGGLVAYNGSTITNCYSTGTVTGEEDTGGLVGYIYEGSISNCYSKGYVTSTGGSTGGLVGYNYESTISNSFWDIETSGQTTSAGGTGKTTAEMKNQTTYTDAGWSYPDIWNINPDLNNGYPYLNYPNSVPNDEIVIETPLCYDVVLHPAYPNPFNPSTTIAFELTSPSDVKIDIFNVKSQLVKHLVNKIYDKGSHSVVWEGRDHDGNHCGTGVYFYRMTAGNTHQTKKMMLMK